MECIILSVKELYMDAQEDMHMNDYNKITALYSRLSVGDEDRDGGESNSIQNQKIFLENYARGQRLTNIRHYIDDDESGRFFDRSAYSRMMEDVENGKIGVCIMKDLTRWGRDYLQVGNAMEIFRRNNVRFIAVTLYLSLTTVNIIFIMASPANTMPNSATMLMKLFMTAIQ